MLLFDRSNRPTDPTFPLPAQAAHDGPTIYTIYHSMQDLMGKTKNRMGTVRFHTVPYGYARSMRSHITEYLYFLV